MINWKIAGNWQNWIIVFLMFAIASFGTKLFVDLMEKK